MSKLKRNTIIKLQATSGERFIVLDSMDRILLQADEEYAIYFKTAFFHSDGVIVARYLGEESGTLLDEDCLPVKYSEDEKEWFVSGTRRTVDAARLASVKNKRGAIVIIEEK